MLTVLVFLMLGSPETHKLYKADTGAVLQISAWDGGVKAVRFVDGLTAETKTLVYKRQDGGVASEHIFTVFEDKLYLFGSAAVYFGRMRSGQKVTMWRLGDTRRHVFTLDADHTEWDRKARGVAPEKTAVSKTPWLGLRNISEARLLSVGFMSETPGTFKGAGFGWDRITVVFDGARRAVTCESDSGVPVAETASWLKGSGIKVRFEPSGSGAYGFVGGSARITGTYNLKTSLVSFGFIAPAPASGSFEPTPIEMMALDPFNFSAMGTAEEAAALKEAGFYQGHTGRLICGGWGSAQVEEAGPAMWMFRFRRGRVSTSDVGKWLMSSGASVQFFPEGSGTYGFGGGSAQIIEDGGLFVTELNLIYPIPGASKD